jgi:hypothetical protein
VIAARRVRIAAGAGMLVCACGAAVAHAQTPVTTRPSPVSGRDVQMSGGVSILTPVGLGSRDITLLTGDGQPFTIARTTNRTGASLGAEARLGFRLNDAVRAELSGGWSRVPFETNVTDDIEGAEALTASINISRFTVGGTAVVRITEYGSRQIFAIAGASWMREATTLGAGSVFEDGANARAAASGAWACASRAASA